MQCENAAWICGISLLQFFTHKSMRNESSVNFCMGQESPMPGFPWFSLGEWKTNYMQGSLRFSCDVGEGENKPATALLELARDTNFHSF